MVQDNDEADDHTEENGEQAVDQESAEGLQDALIRSGTPAPAIPAFIPGQIGDKTIFYSSRPDGGLRDVLTVECLKLNGEDFKGTKTYTEAMVKIFQQELGFTSEILLAVKMFINKCRIVSFKLKNQINIDEQGEL